MKSPVVAWTGRIFAFVSLALFPTTTLAAWQTDGTPIVVAPGYQTLSSVAPDGLGGLLVAWSDSRTGLYDIYVERISAAGVIQWTANGVAVCTQPFTQSSPGIVSDGAGGAIVAWSDSRTGVGTEHEDIYAQRIDAA